MTLSPVLSVIIVTYNDAERLERCLKSIQSCKDEIDHEVIVVDNGSTDRTPALLQSFPSLRVTRVAFNLGIATARNIGIDHSRGNYLLFLDSDTEVRPDCFANAVKALASDPGCWIGGCRTFRSDGSLEYSARSFYTPAALLFRRTALGKWFPNAACLRNHLNHDKDHIRNFVTDWVAGAALIVKREAIEELGYFDEWFAQYLDDYDLCYRTWKRGRTVLYIANSQVIHHMSLRSQKALLPALKHLRSGLYFYLKTWGVLDARTRPVRPREAKSGVTESPE